MLHTENWYVLCVAIIRALTVEQAFEVYSTGKIRNKLTDEDTKDMIVLRQTCTYKEIGEIYNIYDSTVCHRIERYKERQAKHKVKKVNKKVKTTKYIDHPAKLNELKKTHTYKEIAKIYNTYPNKVYMQIKEFNQQV